jgi:MFS family permease
VTHLGGTPFLVGVTLAAFSVTSVLLRPSIGHWADSWSDAGVMIVGVLLLGLSVLLWLVPSIEVIMGANAVRGIAWAGLNTGGYCLLANTAPPARRGEASGYYTGVQSGPTLLVPAVALWLVAAPWGGFRLVIFTSAALAIAGALFGFLVKPSTTPRRPAKPSLPTSRPAASASTFLDHGVLMATVLLLCVTLPNSAASGFLVLYAQHLGVESVGWYFVVSGCTSLLVRPLLGRISDRAGRAQTIVAGLLLQMTGLLIFSAASSLSMIILAGALYSAGAAVGTAATMALAIDLSDPRRRGVAMATFSTAFPMGHGLGALIAGSAVELIGYGGMYIATAALISGGLLFAFVNWSVLSRTTEESHERRRETEEGAK